MGEFDDKLGEFDQQLEPNSPKTPAQLMPKSSFNDLYTKGLQVGYSALSPEERSAIDSAYSNSASAKNMNLDQVHAKMDANAQASSQMAQANNQEYAVPPEYGISSALPGEYSIDPRVAEHPGLVASTYFAPAVGGAMATRMAVMGILAGGGDLIDQAVSHFTKGTDIDLGRSAETALVSAGLEGAGSILTNGLSKLISPVVNKFKEYPAKVAELEARRANIATNTLQRNSLADELAERAHNKIAPVVEDAKIDATFANMEDASAKDMAEIMEHTQASGELYDRALLDELKHEMWKMDVGVNGAARENFNNPWDLLQPTDREAMQYLAELQAPGKVLPDVPEPKGINLLSFTGGNAGGNLTLNRLATRLAEDAGNIPLASRAAKGIANQLTNHKALPLAIDKVLTNAGPVLRSAVVATDEYDPNIPMVGAGLAGGAVYNGLGKLLGR